MLKSDAFVLNCKFGMKWTRAPDKPLIHILPRATMALETFDDDFETGPDNDYSMLPIICGIVGSF